MPATDFNLLPEAEQADRLKTLATAALANWEGRFSEPRLIKYRENAVFSVDREDGQRFALRIHRNGYHSDEALQSELDWMSRLAMAGIEVPPVVPASDGRGFVHAQSPGVPDQRQVDMLGWLGGAPLGSVEEGLETDRDANVGLYFEAGRLAGKLHNASSEMSLPDTFVRHSWCEDGLIGPSPLWGRFWELPQLSSQQRALLDAARRKSAIDLASFGKSSERYGMIHADFVPENLLHENGRLKLIDFDDCGFGWHMFELATALYFIVDEPGFDEMKAALLKGYRAVRALPDEDEAALNLFLFLRGTTYLGWVQTRPETQTARELAPMLIDLTCRIASQYLDR